MKIRFFSAWTGQRQQYQDIEYDNDTTDDELTETASDLAFDQAQVNGWWERVEDEEEVAP